MVDEEVWSGASRHHSVIDKQCIREVGSKKVYVKHKRV